MSFPGAGEWLQDMNYRSHAGMLAGAGSADTLAGGVMSRGAAVGRPLVSAGMGMLGLDPMTMGLRAGMGAWNSGAGVLGAGMAGMGVAAGVGAVGLGAAFVGNQMYSGAQQQLHLNQGLRQNFNFMNGQGGMGFTSQQGFQIGSTLRGMSHEFGPQGEVATFGELSRLATNMGRMGMGNDVRSVKEFKDKFKEMISTLKQVATDMGSSLEEAQKFVSSMRGSGIFRTADQLKMSAGTRLTAAAGGLAMSEVTGMANIGSQISRSIGGLGRQGAFAGMKTIEQIGLAQKVGAINDEDVYNATGMHGAEGRQALATAQLQQSARFLSGGRGRRFLASISGKDGNLNENAVMEYMMGGNVTTSRTMEMAYSNLEGVGRANFIRNEGRLRGAALEKFGGLAQSLVYKQWLSSRGYDPTSMDDKSMLAFQRFSGMGRDEADLAIKQIQRMPEMMAEMKNAKSELAYSDELNKYNKTIGIEGLKRKFEQTREKIQGSLQQAGADILEGGSEELARWFNRTMGVYERRQIEGVAEVIRMAKSGHVGAGREMDKMTAGSAIMPGAGKLGGGLGALGGGALSGQLRLANAQNAALGASVTAGDTAFMSKNRDAFRSSYLESAAGKSGLDRAEAIREIVRKQGGDVREFDAATDETAKIAWAARQEKAAGFGDAGGIAKSLTGKNLRINDKGLGATSGEVDELIGKGLIDRQSLGDKIAGRAGEDMLSAALGPIGALVNVGRGVANYFGDKADAAAAGAWTKSKEGRNMIGGIMAGSGSDFEAAQNRMQELLSKGEDHLDRNEKGQLRVIRSSMAARELGLALNGRSPDQLTAQEKEAIAAKASKVAGRKVTFDEVLSGAQSIAGALDINAQAALREFRERAETDITGMRKEFEAAGAATLNKDGSISVTAGRLDDIEKIGGKDARAAYETAMKIAGMKFDGTEGDRAKLQELYGTEGSPGLYAKMQQGLAGATLQQKRELAKKLGAGDPVAQMYAQSAARQERLENQIKRTKEGPARNEVAMATLMGIDVDKDMRKAMSEGSVNQVADMLLAKQGVKMSDEGASAYRAQVIESLTKGRQGKTGEAADALAAAEAGTSGTATGKALEKFRDSKLPAQERSAKALDKIADQAEKQTALLTRIADKKSPGDPEYTDGNGGAGPPRPPQPGGGK